MIKNSCVAAQFEAIVAQTETTIPPQITAPDTEAIWAQSAARFRRLADNAPVLIWGSGIAKRCTYVNQPWPDFTGRSLDSELGKGWTQGVHPEDLRRCLNTYTQCFDRREKFSMEYRLRRYDGEYRWILDIGVPRFEQDGSFVRNASAALPSTLV